jgi:hypothetical protein
VRGEENNHIVTTLGRLDDDRLQTFQLDWTEDGPHFVVAGAPGTGKTNLLQAAVLSAAGAYSPQGLRFLLVDFSGRSLRALDGLKHVIARVMDANALEAQLSLLEAEHPHPPAPSPLHGEGENNPSAVLPHTVIVIDDYDATSETLLAAGGQALKRLRDLARLPNEAGMHFWVAGYMERTGDLLLRQLLLHRSGFGLCSRESLGVFGIRTSQLPAEIMPEGRSYFAQHNQIAVVQTALVENAALMVNRLNQQVWGNTPNPNPHQQHSQSHSADSPYTGEGEVRESLRPSPTENHEAEEGEVAPPPLEIDTAGLIADLMNALPPEPEEKKSEPIPPQPKTRKRRRKKAE